MDCIKCETLYSKRTDSLRDEKIKRFQLNKIYKDRIQGNPTGIRVTEMKFFQESNWSENC